MQEVHNLSFIEEIDENEHNVEEEILRLLIYMSEEVEKQVALPDSGFGEEILYDILPTESRENSCVREVFLCLDDIVEVVQSMISLVDSVIWILWKFCMVVVLKLNNLEIIQPLDLY